MDKLPISLTTEPIVTGASCIGLKYHDGVLLCADLQASYGTSRKFKDFCRISRISDNCAISASGEMSDFQFMAEKLQDECLKDNIQEDGSPFLSAKEYANFIGVWTYYKRRRLNPLYNIFIVGGFDGKGEKYLSYVDLYGTHLVGDYMVTGLAHYFCKVMLANYSKPDMSEGDAKKLLEQCMRILVYHDARAFEKIQFCTITKKGVNIEKPYEIKTDWSSKYFIHDTNEKRLGITGDYTV